MKNVIVALLFIVCFATNLNSQTKYSQYGGAMTPKNSLRGLVIFVGFGADADNIWVDGWNDVFPDWAKNKISYYSDTNDFKQPISANDKFNISRWYFEMSKNSPRPFKLMLDFDYIKKKDYIANYFINNRRKNL